MFDDMVDEKEEFINLICDKLRLSTEDIKSVRNSLYIGLRDYSLTKITNTDIVVSNESEDEEALRMFFISKRVAGCTDRTLKYYQLTIEAFLMFIQKPIKDIGTNDTRYYLAVKKERDRNSDVNINNIRRVLSSFFGWLLREEYIPKNPMLRIDVIRVEKRKKKAFTDIEIERLRAAVQPMYLTEKRKAEKTKQLQIARMNAFVELMLSTGARITEVVNLNRQDVQGDEVTVYGKGKKERVVYLNAKAKIAIDRYLSLREDTEEPLFVSVDHPHARLLSSAHRINLKMLGRFAQINDVHPHRFRRTAATLALNRGMPIEQVQKMLGHENIETTTLYAIASEEALKMNHKKYVTG